MAKKKIKNNEEIPDQKKAESVEKDVQETESVLDETEAILSDESLPEAEDIQQLEQADETVEEVQPEEVELSPDDLFDDVRRSLIEENAKVEEEKKPRWWQKLGKRGRKETDSDQETPVVEDAEDLVELDETEEEIAVDQQDVDGESIDELIGILEADDENVSEPVVDAVVEHEEPDVEVEKADLNELKKRAFQGSAPDDEDENFSDVRAVALEGGEEVFVEVDVKTEDPMEDRLKSFENALRPYRRYINLGIAFIGIVVIVATSALLFDAYKQSLPPEPTKVVENLPYPVVLNIPGGLSFNLGRGTLEDGRWDPRRPEWLEGTEICRWVAIPHSRQLEAVIRTLTPEDQLELVMSNNDRWSYDVYSRTQMSIEEMQKISSNSPCLLLVLADVSTDTRWVVTAYP